MAYRTWFLSLIIVYSLSMSHKNSAIAIIFDIDGFLVTEVMKKVIWEVGPTNFIGFYNPTTIKEDYFKLLDTIRPHQQDSTQIIRDGYVLPQLITDWLTNKQTPEQIRSLVIQELQKISHLQGRSTKIPQGIANYVFSPERYASTMVVQKKALRILQKCHAKKGRYGHKLYLLTNWNLESFNWLMTNPEIKAIISLFDARIISGEAHRAKPDPKFYEYAFSHFKIDDSQGIVYLDCEINNIRALQNIRKSNTHCIHCKNLDFKFVDKEFKRLGIY